MDRKSIVSIAAAVMLWPAIATADSPKLKGTYAFTGMGTCLYSGAPFTPDLKPVVWPGWTPTGAGPNTGGFAATGKPSGNGIFT